MIFHCPFCKVNVDVLGMQKFVTHPFFLKGYRNDRIYKYYECVRCKVKFAHHHLGEWIWIKNDDEWIVLEEQHHPIEIGVPISFRFEGEIVFAGKISKMS